MPCKSCREHNSQNRVAVPSNLGSMEALYQEYEALMTPAEPCRSPEALAAEFKRRGHQDPGAEGDVFLEEIFEDNWAGCQVQKAAAVDTNTKTAGFVDDEDIVDELILWIDNTEPLYRQKLLCYKNLVNKQDRGIYDRGLAVKLMLYCVDAAAKDYVRELGVPEDAHGGPQGHGGRVGREVRAGR